jgi:hypothetical protein
VTHGGIAQGVGQALLENSYYEPQNGQLLAASFMDYAMPRADELPSFATTLSEVPSPTNRLGVRSGGEGGTTPALAAVINAIVDALAELGVRHIEMPATPERVWHAIRAAAEEECEGVDHPKVLAARNQLPASQGAYPSGLEHSSRSYQPLAQTSALGAVQAQGSTEGGAGRRHCCDHPRRLFRDESRLSSAAQADRGVCSRERCVQ